MPNAQQLTQHIQAEIEKVKAARALHVKTVSEVSPNECGFEGLLSLEDEKKLQRRCPELTIGELSAAMRRWHGTVGLAGDGWAGTVSYVALRGA